MSWKGDLYHFVLEHLPAEQSLQLQHLLEGRHVANIRRPRRFNEKILHRKWTENDPRFADLSDKVKVKTYVEDRIGKEFVIPTIWSGDQLPDDIEKWPRPFVIKANHASGWNIFVLDGQRVDWADIRKRTAGWMKSEFRTWLHERWYNRIDRKLLVEGFIGEQGSAPPDFKFFVFNGAVQMIQVDVGRFTDHRRNLYDRNWKQRSEQLMYQASAAPIAKPIHAAEMLALAEKLGTDFDFVRVDFYDLPEGPKFGEMTFSPGSGNERFMPVALDYELGTYW